jgi:anti-sigma factor RsiW
MTDCLNSAAPNNEELLRFALDGEALSAEEGKHLEQCTSCQQRLASYKNTHTFLLARLYRSRCPNSTKLSLYCADLLLSNERLSIANHLLDCPLCAAEAADTRQFLLAKMCW